MNEYVLTSGTREEFDSVRAKMISDVIQQFTEAEVTNKLLGPGKIVSCINYGDNLESLIFTINYSLNEEKNYGAMAAMASGSLKFNDESLNEAWGHFVEVHNNLKHQLYEAETEAKRLQKEADKLEKKRIENEKKMASMKVSAEKEVDGLVNNRSKCYKDDKAKEFFYSLGWLASHVGTIVAKMPDYLESAFTKHFGDVEHTVVDSTKVGPAGYTSQWRLSMEASLKKADNIPSTLNDYLSQSGKKVAKTSFVWSLVDDYGFKFGKKQDVVDILRCVPIEYVPAFNEGLNA